MAHFIVVVVNQEVHESPDRFDVDIYHIESNRTKEWLEADIICSNHWSDYFQGVKVFEVDRKPEKITTRVLREER